MNHGGTQNFTDIKLDRMQQHPSVQAIRIGRTKPYECSYPVIAERPRIPERSKEDGDASPRRSSPSSRSCTTGACKME